MLVTDHNVRETLTLCDRIYVLFAGRVLAAGPSSEIVDDPEVRRHFLGESFELIDVANRSSRFEPTHAECQPVA